MNFNVLWVMKNLGAQALAAGAIYHPAIVLYFELG